MFPEKKEAHLENTAFRGETTKKEALQSTKKAFSFTMIGQEDEELMTIYQNLTCDSKFAAKIRKFLHFRNDESAWKVQISTFFFKIEIEP